MKKKVLSIVLAVCLLLSLVPMPAMATESTGTAHTHNDKTFTAVSDEAGLTDAAQNGGSVYLAKDIELNAALEIVKSKILNLCLNGHDLKLKKGVRSCPVIKIDSTAMLNLYDCNTTVRYGWWESKFPDYKYSITNEQPSAGDYDTLIGGCITGNEDRGMCGVENSGSFNMYGGNIAGKSCIGSNNAGGVCNREGSSFIMNGGSIVGNFCEGSNSAGGVYNSDGVFSDMYGGNITDNACQGDHGGSGGVYNNRNAQFTMHDGNITGNFCSDGSGGVLNNVTATFIINDGNIADNTTSGNMATGVGGGVYNIGTLEMYGGSITGNSAYEGGGVYNTGTFGMYDGSIAGNTATDNGGGVYNIDIGIGIGTLEMYGGSITDNMAKNNGGGVYNGGTFKMSGRPQVTGNTKSKAGESVAENVYLSGDKTITITDALSASAKIGVTTSSTPAANTPVAIATGKLKSTDAGHILADSGDQASVLQDNKIQLIQATELSEKGGKLKAGNYYLTGDILKLKTNLTIAKDEPVTLNLCGHVLVGNGNAAPVITIESGATLNLVDSGATVRYGRWEDDSYVIDDDAKAGGDKLIGGLITGGNATNGGSGVYNSGTFNMYSGNIAGNTAVETGGGVYNSTNAAFTMYGGSITGNKATGDSRGGGVYNDKDASFSMCGATIADNKAVNGGGVFNLGQIDASNGGAGGSITDNKAVNGGGVFNENELGIAFIIIKNNTAEQDGGGVYNKGGNLNFVMTDGIIKNNTAERDGGGVYNEADNGVFLMTAGIIKNNTAEGDGGGVYNGNTIILNYHPQIRDNVKKTGTESAANNVFLETGAHLALTNSLTDDAAVGVTVRESTNPVIDVAVGGHESQEYKIKTEDMEKLTPDSDAYDIRLIDNENKIELVRKYTITFDLNGRGSIAEKEITDIFGSKITAPDPTPTATGYTFGGWYKEDNFTNPWVFDGNSADTIAADQTLHAKWTANTYKVSFNANGGKGDKMADQSFTYDADKQALSKNTYTRVGYTFDGWSTEKDGDRVYTDELHVNNLTAENNGTVTLYARWKINTYSIAYDLGGGTFKKNESNPAAYTVETEAFTLHNPVKTGYTFIGWTWDGQTEPKMNVTIAKGSTGNESYTARWTANAYKVSFDRNGGKGDKMANQSLTYDADKQALTKNIYTRSNYTFAGWNTQADGKGVSYADKALVNNLTPENNGTVTLYAQWKADTSDVESTVNTGAPQVAEPAVKSGMSQAEKNAMNQATEALKAPGAVQETGLSKKVSVKKNANGDFIIETGAKISPVIDAETVSHLMEVNHLTDASVVAEPSLRVQVTGAKTDSTSGIISLTLDIKPLVNVKLQSGSFSQILATPVMEHVDGKITITLTLPESFTVPAGYKIQVLHTKDDGTQYTYDVERDSNRITFVNPNGFSTFTVQTVPISAKTGDDSHTILWANLAVATACGAAYVVLYQRKKKEQDR